MTRCARAGPLPPFGRLKLLTTSRRLGFGRTRADFGVNSRARHTSAGLKPGGTPTVFSRFDVAVNTVLNGRHGQFFKHFVPLLLFGHPEDGSRSGPRPAALRVQNCWSTFLSKDLTVAKSRTGLPGLLCPPYPRPFENRSFPDGDDGGCDDTANRRHFVWHLFFLLVCS